MRLLVVSCAPVVSSFTLSLACLLLTAITVRGTCGRHDGSFPLHPLVALQSAPSSPSVLVSLSPFLSSCLPHIVTHGDTAPLIMSLFVSLPSPPANAVLMFFPAGPPRVYPSASVMSEFWWNLTSRSTGDDMSDEPLNQYLLVCFFLSFLFYCL